MSEAIKPRFKRKIKHKKLERINSDFGSKELKVVETEAKITEMEMLITEWCVKYPPSFSPYKFLKEVKRFTPRKCSAYMKAVPITEWQSRRRSYQEMILKDQVKGHLDFVTEMNDLHIKASKLGLAKAIEMLSKMEIKSYVDKGIVKFSRFRSTDLKNCLESIAIAQKIQRTALGLPSDEGAITIWNQLNVNQGNIAGDAYNDIASVDQLDSMLEYDDIKALIEAQRGGQIKLPSKIVDVEGSNDQKTE